MNSRECAIAGHPDRVTQKKRQMHQLSQPTVKSEQRQSGMMLKLFQHSPYYYLLVEIFNYVDWLGTHHQGS